MRSGRFGSLARRLLTSTHLAPSLVSRGGAAIQNISDFGLPIADFLKFKQLKNRQSAIRNRQLQRSFQLSPELLATTRQARLHGSDTYVQSHRDLFIGKAFYVSQDHRFSVNATQST